MKKHIKLNTVEEFLETIGNPKDENVRENIKYLFNKLKEKEGWEVWFVSILCPFCERIDKLHMSLDKKSVKNKTVYQKILNDEPLKVMCMVCGENMMILFSQGITDFETVKIMLKQMR